MTHAHNPDVAARLLDDYIHQPERWEQCARRRLPRMALRRRLARTHYKCALFGNSHGPRTDVRLKWPACTQWEAKT